MRINTRLSPRVQLQYRVPERRSLGTRLTLQHLAVCDGEYMDYIIMLFAGTMPDVCMMSYHHDTGVTPVGMPRSKHCSNNPTLFLPHNYVPSFLQI